MDYRTNSAFEFSVFSAKCPHCSSVAEFGMVRKAYQKFGMELGVEHVLMCSQCGYEKDVDDGTADVWKGLAKAYQALVAGEASQEQFDDLLGKLDLPELNGLLEDAVTWTCKCGEESPSNFSECWNCGESSPDVIADDSIEDTD